MATDHPEIFKVDADTHRIACDGGKGALGHPKVYYSFDGADEVTCGYCDRLFTKKNRKGAQLYNPSKAA